MTTTNAGRERWAKRLLGGFGVLILVAVVLRFATAGTTTGGMAMGEGFMWGGSWLGWGLMWIIGLLWLIAIVAIPMAVLYWLIDGRSRETNDEALAILRERYARGEIDEEAYETRRTRLENR